MPPNLTELPRFMVKIRRSPAWRLTLAALVLAAAACAAPAPTQGPIPAGPATMTNPAPAANAALASPETTEAKAAADAEYHKLTESDDEAQAEVDQWIRQNDDAVAQGGGLPKIELRRRILERFEPVRKAYLDFLARHPNHVNGRIAYASFLGDLDDEGAAEEQLNKALELDPNNPAIYNNLANIYGHRGPVRKAFEYFTKALQFKPEAVYYHNFATTLYAFRKVAMDFYALNEQQVFEKALNLYSNASRLDPSNFPFASDVADTYYAIKPLRTNDALRAWTNALNVAHNDVEREGVHIHLARLKMVAGRLAEAKAQLTTVTNSIYTELKSRLVQGIADRQGKPAGSNAPPAAVVEKARPPAAVVGETPSTNAPPR